MPIRSSALGVAAQDVRYPGGTGRIADVRHDEPRDKQLERVSITGRHERQPIGLGLEVPRDRRLKRRRHQ